METEIWKVYKDARGKQAGCLWEVSNLANVKKNGKHYTCSESASGYLVFACVLLHRAVAELFIGPIPEGYEVDHIDGNKLNNRVDNLKICTHKENMLNPITRAKISAKIKGEKHPMYGKHHTVESRALMSEKRKGEKHPNYGKQSANRGLHCFNNGIVNKYAYECPEGFKPGMLRKSAS